MLLTETATVFTLVGVLALLAATLLRPTRTRALALGAAAGWTALLRPSLLLLGPLLLAALLLDARRRRRLDALVLLLFAAAALAPPLVWSLCNQAHYGHTFYTRNQTVTLQNFTGPRFADLPVDDPRLRVLQRHVREALVERQHYAMNRALNRTRAELGETDVCALYDLIDTANRRTLAAHPRAFAAGGWRRFRAMWSEGFVDVKNRYA